MAADMLKTKPNFYPSFSQIYLFTAADYFQKNMKIEENSLQPTIQKIAPYLIAITLYNSLEKQYCRFD